MGTRSSFTIAELKDLYNTGTMISLPYQRPVDDVRVDNCRQWILENYNKPSFYLPDIVLNKINGIYHIIDGQHRIHSIISITIESMMNFKVGVFIKDGLTVTEEKMLFISINKSVPCSDMVIPKPVKKEILNNCKNFLYKIGGSCVSDSIRCKTPNFHIQKLLEDFCNNYSDGSSCIGDWYKDNKISTSAELNKEITQFNEYIGKIFNSSDGFKAYRLNCPRHAENHDEKKFRKNLLIIMTKADKDDNNPCYLGMVNYHRISHCLFNHKKFF